jgi:hypothetical protein
MWCAVCYEDRDTINRPDGRVECTTCTNTVDWWGVVRAWDLIGYEGDKRIRIVGGKALYETVIYFDGQRSDKVKLARLDVTPQGLRTTLRWVDPDTLVELVERGGET